MATDEQRRRFAEILAEALPEDVRDVASKEWWNASLLVDLGLDSLATVGVIAEVEDEFNIELPDQSLTMDAFRSPLALWSTVEEVLGRDPNVMDAQPREGQEVLPPHPVPYVDAGVRTAPVLYAHGPLSERDANVPEGERHEFVVSDPPAYPGTSRRVIVHLPSSYSPERPHPVMVFLDGGLYYDPHGEVRGGIVLDNLVARREIPPVLGVFVDPGEPGNRNVEDDAFDSTFCDFLLEEVLARVSRRWNIADTARYRGICGGSSGGNASLTAAWTRPDAFSKVVSFLGSFAQMADGNPYPAKASEVDPKPIRVFMGAGSFDLNHDAATMNWFGENLKTAAALAEAGYDLRLVLGDGGHDLNHGGVLLPEALRWIWRDEE